VDLSPCATILRDGGLHREGGPVVTIHIGVWEEMSSS